MKLPLNEVGPGDSEVLLPDDYRYSYIVESLDHIALDEDADSFAFDHEVYTSDLFAWLSSNLIRSGYVDDANTEGLIAADADMAARCMMGQVVERREVFASVLASLEARVAEVAA